jgi:PPK2 family polyphosphate:nucleotide phosphotransferase
MKFIHQLTPGESISINDLPTSGKDIRDDRDKVEKEFKKLRKEMIEWQNCLYAEGKQKLLIVIQAMDAGGKDSTIRRVFQGINPQGVKVTSFKNPSTKELAHDYLWRVHQAVPAKGMIGIFNRSHYGDVLVVRVDQLVPEEVWRPRYEQINHFEKMLSDSGTVILKFFLHISKEEQKERFQERLDFPDKHWKFDHNDLIKRRQWNQYMEAYEEMLNRCTTDWAPWHVIPADQKWYRNLAIAETIVETLRKMNPQYDIVKEDLSKIKID